ncbi:MAG: hypothetical protein JO345_23425 [Streptosporangiaceae bacterium]|nr:hypothetical protein [Streptosporangiaceae bacterium]
MARVGWKAVVAALEAGRLSCSGSEAGVLRIAASIAEGIGVDLAEAVTGLDETNIVLVARAVLHANGHRAAVVTVAGVERR